MQISVFDDDEPMHHQAGKDIFVPCPRVTNTPTARRRSISLVKISPPVTISPPSKQHILEQCQLQQDRRRTGMLGFFHKVLGKLHLHESNTIVVNNYIYQGFSIQAYNNYKNMQIIGQINNWGTIQENNYCGSKEHREEQEEAQDSDDSDRAEAVEVQPAPACDTPNELRMKQKGKKRKLPFTAYIADKSKTKIIMEWLHQSMDPIDTPKEKLIYLRALAEEGYFTELVPRNAFMKEFGPISKSRYSAWMGETLHYDRGNIDSIIGHLPF